MKCDQLVDGICRLIDSDPPEDMCQHCQGDKAGIFRAQLVAAHTRRELVRRLAEGGESFECHRYGGIKVDGDFCSVCRTNPALKQMLGASRTKTSRLRIPCRRRGEATGSQKEIKCCGGRVKLVDLYHCAKRGEVHNYQCLTCADYEDPEGPKPEPIGCVPWPDLWHVHEGKTIFVLACGPSVLLPGELPDADTVDPRGVERDIVLSTNWAWKWYGDICDYQLCYDPGPAFGWRPPHLKLLTVYRPRQVMEKLKQCSPYCIFPACDYGEIAQGKPLPTSRNSGFTALAMAAYMGAKTIKVLGMDFGPARGRMHFYYETDSDVDRRVKSFGRQKERVQADLTKLLTQIRGMDIEVENLSPISTLDWGAK